jgi:hypothetical protein
MSKHREPGPGTNMQSGVQRVEARLALMVADGADATSIAEVACEVWRNMALALSPIIGQHGTAALYKRSLHLTRIEHTSLSAVHDAAGDVGDFTALHHALAGQSSADAAQANGALLKNFHDLLSSLIGAALTERLLRPALDKPSTHHAAQDPQP